MYKIIYPQLWMRIDYVSCRGGLICTKTDWLGNVIIARQLINRKIIINGFWNNR